jgi:putative copper resistance protein D
MDVDVSSAAVRALAFIAQFQAAGAAFFLTLYARGGAVPVAPVARFARRSALAGILLVLAHQLLDAARMSGEFRGLLDPAMQQLALDSSAALANAVRVVGLILIAHGLWRAERAGRRASPSATAGGLMVCASFLIVGHTSIHPLRWLLAPLLLLHLVVVAGWFGALLPLCMTVRSGAAVQAAAVVEAFSRLATRAVPLIFIAGATIALTLLPGIAALRESYGRLLLAKVAGFGLLMLFAALNKWRLTPALARGETAAAGALTRSMQLEWLIIAAVLCVTAALTTFYSPEG